MLFFARARRASPMTVETRREPLHLEFRSRFDTPFCRMFCIAKSPGFRKFFF
jgi:hypothetical protein